MLEHKEIDLRNCKKGQKLLSRFGKILTYIEPLSPGNYFDHIIQYPDGSQGTRTHDGYVFKRNRAVTDEDVVQILLDDFCKVFHLNQIWTNADKKDFVVEQIDEDGKARLKCGMKYFSYYAPPKSWKLIGVKIKDIEKEP